MIKVQGTTFSFRTLDDWRELHHGRLLHGRARKQEYARQDRIFRALKPEMIRRSHDIGGLRRLNDYLRAPSGIGFIRFDAGRDWKPHHTALVMATHDRIHQLETGAAYRDRVRHGPADPAQMPDRALDRVIQTCHDMDLVEACRAAKAKRMTVAA